MERIKAVMNWSGGKDSAHALWRILRDDRYEVVALLTTINRATRRSTMHAIPTELLEAQAEAIGIPLYVVNLTPKGTMEDYSSAMEQAARHFLNRGVRHFIFGDIHLHDVRSYRERQLAPLGIEVVEPLWGASSREVIDAFLETDLRTIVVTTTADGLGKAAIGREIDRAFIDSLPKEMDPNGENGEYHTFCYAGSIFRHPVAYTLGKPYTQSFDIRLEDGSTQTFGYWFSELSVRK